MTLDEFAQGFDFCFLCFRDAEELFGLDRLHIHRIERRSGARARLRDERVNLLRACRACHENDLATMAHGWQLGAKLFSDPDCAEGIADLLRQWLPIRIMYRAAPNRVTEAEVMNGLAEIVNAGYHLDRLAAAQKAPNYKRYCGRLAIFAARHPDLYQKARELCPSEQSA